MTPATTKINSTFPAAFASAQAANSATRQQHQLDPAGNDRRAAAQGPAGPAPSDELALLASVVRPRGAEPPFAGSRSRLGAPRGARLELPIICLPPSPEYG